MSITEGFVLETTANSRVRKIIIYFNLPCCCYCCCCCCYFIELLFINLQCVVVVVSDGCSSITITIIMFVNVCGFVCLIDYANE